MVDDLHRSGKLGPIATDSRAASLRGRLFRLSVAPDWSSNRAMLWTALAAGLIVCLAMAFNRSTLPGFRDTDDAMRLVMARGLVDGRGWYDQLLTRLDPPYGLWPHWSRLIDGGVAGLIALFRTFLSPAQAEYGARFVWPLLWVVPATWAALALARNFGARSAVFLAAFLMLIDPNAYRQFVPGRIDHHDLQIMPAAIAMACATMRAARTRWAIVGGAATGFGLAIGLEALPLQALIGASYAVALVRDPGARRPAAAYGLSLALVAVALFLIQTPPARWSLSFCDALALNLTAAVIVAGGGLALAAALSARVGAPARVALVAVAGAASLAVYLGLDPQCLRGPFAGMNPEVKRFWFDRVQEVQSLDKMMRIERPAAIAAACLLAVSLAAAVVLAVRRWRAWDTGVLTLVAGIGLSAVIAWFAWRMQDYVYWLGLPALAAALSWIAERYWRALMLPSALAAFILSPTFAGAVITRSITLLGPRPKMTYVDAGPRCFAASAYAPLARFPTGDILAPQDLGPFILVYSAHSVVAAPYHRLSNAILAAHLAWAAPPRFAEARVRALGADYLLDCPPYPLMVGPGSLGAALRRGQIPPWLQRLTPPTATLQLYRVLPTGAGTAGVRPN
jgi:hypothetical protein